MMRLGFFALLFMACTSVEAGTPSADLGLEVGIQPGGVMPPGTDGVLSLSITNYGPDAQAGLIGWAATDDGVGFSFPPLDFTGVVKGSCGVSPIGQPGPGDTFGFVLTPDLEPGETAICTFGFRVRETTTLSQIAQWGVGPFGSAEDPNDSNNLVEVLLIFSPLGDIRPVPTLSWVGMLSLALLVWLAAIRQNKWLLRKIRG